LFSSDEGSGVGWEDGRENARAAGPDDGRVMEIGACGWLGAGVVCGKGATDGACWAGDGTGVGTMTGLGVVAGSDVRLSDSSSAAARSGKSAAGAGFCGAGDGAGAGTGAGVAGVGAGDVGAGAAAAGGRLEDEAGEDEGLKPPCTGAGEGAVGADGAARAGEVYGCAGALEPAGRSLGMEGGVLRAASLPAGVADAEEEDEAKGDVEVDGIAGRSGAGAGRDAAGAIGAGVRCGMALDACDSGGRDGAPEVGAGGAVGRAGAAPCGACC
jgi:hypothetical protein